MDTLCWTCQNAVPIPEGKCLHSILPYTTAGRTPEEIQKIKDFSNPKKNPFSVDPRSQKQVEAYRKKEKARANWLRNYRQWEQYRITLGDKVPKTYQTFEKHKRANDEKYKNWQKLYREANQIGTVSHTIELPGNIPGIVPAGATIQGVRRIAGYGTGAELRDAGYLAADFGGDPLKWEKKGGIIETDHYRYDVHWYELNGIHYKEKVKGMKQK